MAGDEGRGTSAACTEADADEVVAGCSARGPKTLFVMNVMDPSQVRSVGMKARPNRVEYRGALRLELVGRANPQSIRLTGQRTASWLLGR